MEYQDEKENYFQNKKIIDFAIPEDYREYYYAKLNEADNIEKLQYRINLWYAISCFDCLRKTLSTIKTDYIDEESTSIKKIK